MPRRSPSSGPACCASSGFETFSAVSRCLPDRRKGSRPRRGRRVSLRKHRGRAGAVATARILRGLQPHAGKARMWPASPQSITRCAMLIPAPVRLRVRSHRQFAHRTAVNAHPNLQTGMFLERPADLHRALRRRLRTGVKDQRHPVAGRDFK